MPDSPSPVDAMTRDDLNVDQTVDGGVARLVLAQAVRGLEDLLSAKKQFETKASVLLAAFAPTGITLTGVYAVGGSSVHFSFWYLMAGLCFGAAAMISAWALRDQIYGTPGIQPKNWVTRYWMLDMRAGKEDRLAAIFAIDLQAQIDQTITSNTEKADRIMASLMIASVGALIAIVVAILGAAQPAAQPAAKSALEAKGAEAGVAEEAGNWTLSLL